MTFQHNYFYNVDNADTSATGGSDYFFTCLYRHS